ncbi:MAG: peptidase serine carboxypeptidase, partial [Bryobacterales bacterium]|nr:peptidase serine carboxypeptidase [Bryobacterales bacterium]
MRVNFTEVSSGSMAQSWHNRFMLSWILFALLLLQAGRPPADAPKPPDTKAAEKAKEPEEEKPVVTHHEIRAGGKSLKYTATAGLMPIRNAKGETEAHMFFVAYTLDGVSDTRRRPLMFSFNGGPGSASVWLHLGALGPKRVVMLNNGEMPAPPFHLVDNEYTWLDQTDLVFIDPVGTGYSRATKPELNKNFWNLRGDIQSVGEFIRMYLTRNE